MPSYVQCHTQSANVTSPNAIATDWNCKIDYRGTDSRNAITFNACTSTAGFPQLWVDGHATAVYANKLIGDLNIIKSAAAINPTYYGGVANQANVDLAYMCTRANSDPGRLIGIAIEVHNTTAELSKQGSLTAALYDDVCPQQTALFTYQAIPEFSIPAQCSSHVETEGELRAIPGAGAWEAKKGVYIIPRMRGEAEISSGSQYTPECIYDSNGQGVVSNMTETIAVNVPTPGPVGRWFYPPQRANKSAFQPACIYLSGLSGTTSLRVTLRTIVEYFPNPNSGNISLAHPSPPYDPAAFIAYHEAARKAPWAVPVSMNAGGDYFRMVLSTLSEWVPRIGDLVGMAVPGAAAVGHGAGALFQAMSQAGRPVNREIAGPMAMPTSNNTNNRTYKIPAKKKPRPVKFSKPQKKRL